MSNIKYGFIVGKDNLVPTVLKTATSKKLDFVVAAIKGVANKSIVNNYNNFWFNLGEIGFLMQQLKDHKVSHVVLIGSLSRPSFFNLKTDAMGKQFIKDNLKAIFGDDSLLKAVINTFKSNGFEVVGVQEIDNNILSPQGLLTNTLVPEESLEDVKNGFSFAKNFSKFDVGQSIIFQQNVVVGIEAIEGTNNLIKRTKKLIKSNGPKALLVKVVKINQDTRVDLPTIGLKTIKACKCSKIKGVVIEANKTIILNKEQTIKLANKYKIFIIAM